MFWNSCYNMLYNMDYIILMESAPTSGFHRLTYRVKKFKTIKKKQKKTETTINSRNISFTGQILDGTCKRKLLSFDLWT